MACDTGAKPIAQKEKIINNDEIIEKKEIKMSSSLVLRKAPEFKLPLQRWKHMMQRQVTIQK